MPNIGGQDWDSDQWGNIYLYVRIGYDLHAPYAAYIAALCAGIGENGFVTVGCNKSGHCGVWQLASSWPTPEHPYTDVSYWTNYAYTNGFYGGYGGLIKIAEDSPGIGYGAMANRCQGAYDSDAQGEAYYGQFTSDAEALYNYWYPRVSHGAGPPPGGGGGGGSGGEPSGSPGPTVTPASLLTLIEDDDWSKWYAYGVGNMWARSLSGYLWSQKALNDCKSMSTFTRGGGS